MFPIQCVITVNTSCQYPLLSLQQRQVVLVTKQQYSLRATTYKSNTTRKWNERNRNDNEIKELWVASAKQDVSQQINSWKLTTDKDRDGGGEVNLTASQADWCNVAVTKTPCISFIIYHKAYSLGWFTVAEHWVAAAPDWPSTWPCYFIGQPLYNDSKATCKVSTQNSIKVSKRWLTFILESNLASSH